MKQIRHDFATHDFKAWLAPRSAAVPVGLQCAIKHSVALSHIGGDCRA